MLFNLRHALRSLRRSPGFTAAALLSLALGIGANTAIFTLLDQVLLRTLPVQHPEQLVAFRAKGPISGRVTTDYDSALSFSYPMYRDLRDRGGAVLEGALARFPVDLSLSFKGHTERVEGDLVSGNFFEVLGAGAALGRTLLPEDDRLQNAHPVAVLNYAFWKRRFGGDAGVLNAALDINGHPFTIVGVARPGFEGVSTTRRAAVFVPMMMKEAITPGWVDLDNRRSYWLNVIARLKPGVTAPQAEAALNPIWRPILEMEAANNPRASAKFRKEFANKHLSLIDAANGFSALRASVSAPLVVLMCMVGLVLLIACANVANLLIARAAARRKEIGVRLALGAGRWRIVKQLLVESTVLAIGGGALGVLVSVWGASLLVQMLPSDAALAPLNPNPDARVLLFTLALSVFTGVVFGLAPALQSADPNLAETLRAQAGGVLGGFGQARLRRLLVVGQVALSLLLLIGAGLFLRSLAALRGVDPGFRAERLLSFTIDPMLNGYTREQINAFNDRLRPALASIGGVAAVSEAEEPVLADAQNMRSLERVEGYTPKPDQEFTVHINSVGPRFFSTLGLPLAAGREFDERDGARSGKVAMVNQKFADDFFSGRNPVGSHLYFGGPKPEPVEIIAVVKNAKYDNFREEPRRFVYLPYSQDITPASATFYVRSGGDPAQTGAAVRRQIRQLDPNLPVFGMRTMEQQIDESLFNERVIAMLSAFFGLLATFLAAVGLYGITAYAVARRTREIGIRMALGAGRRPVLLMVMGEVALLAIIGIVIALPASFPLTRLLQSQLFGIGSHDPATLALATLLLLTVSLFAGYLPAQRATRLDPVTALRYDG